MYFIQNPSTVTNPTIEPYCIRLPLTTLPYNVTNRKDERDLPVSRSLSEILRCFWLTMKELHEIAYVTTGVQFLKKHGLDTANIIYDV